MLFAVFIALLIVAALLGAVFSGNYSEDAPPFVLCGGVCIIAGVVIGHFA